MSDTPVRLLSLLSLLQTPREWPGSELAGRLGVTARTIRRDIDRLRDLGYPVETTMGPDGGYRLAAGAAMPPLLLDDEEAVAIAVGLRTAAGQAVHGIGEASVRALGKLERVLPSRLRHRVGALAASTVALPLPDGPRVDPEVLTVLTGAAANRERARFAYEAADGGASRRLVEPYQLIATGRRWYLIAYDNDRDAWRTFRADRITEPRAIGQRFQPRELPETNPQSQVTSALYPQPPSYTPVATLRIPAAEARRRLGDRQGEIEPVDDVTCRLRGPADTLEWLAARLIMLGCEFEVHEPPELVAHLREAAGRALRATGG
jgi:predicted DNA-binding transcriptional regulator YafY